MNEPSTDQLEWTTEDRRAAIREGWDLFESDASENGPLQLCKIDDRAAHQDCWGLTIEQVSWTEDNEAWVWVMRNPSDLHAKALAVLAQENPIELAAIERWMAQIDSSEEA